LLQGPVGEIVESLSIFGGLWKGSISLCESSVRGAPFWGFRRIWGEGFRGWTSPHGGPLTGNSERLF